MALTVEAEYVVGWAADRALADATLNTTLGLGGRVYRDLAPAGTASPYATVSILASVDLNTLAGRHVWSDAQYLWKVSAIDGTYSSIRPLADRIAALFDRWTLEQSGLVTVTWRRVGSPHEPPELLLGGQIVRTINQLFQSEAHSLS
jgi:hypothetical protein